MVLNNLCSLYLSISNQSIIKFTASWSISLMFSLDFILKDMFDSNPFNTRNIVACLFPWIHLVLAVYRFFCV